MKNRDEKRCVVEVRTVGTGAQFHQCSRTGSLQFQNKWYCKKHHPPTVEARRKEKDAKFTREQSRRQLLAFENQQRVETQYLIEYCQDYAIGYATGKNLIGCQFHMACTEVRVDRTGAMTGPRPIIGLRWITWFEFDGLGPHQAPDFAQGSKTLLEALRKQTDAIALLGLKKKVSRVENRVIVVL
jgi:hypothetical protein